MVANVQTMAYHGKVPWPEIGTPARALDKAVERAATWQ